MWEDGQHPEDPKSESICSDIFIDFVKDSKEPEADDTSRRQTKQLKAAENEVQNNGGDISVKDPPSDYSVTFESISGPGEDEDEGVGSIDGADGSEFDYELEVDFSRNLQLSREAEKVNKEPGPDSPPSYNTDRDHTPPPSPPKIKLSQPENTKTPDHPLTIKDLSTSHSIISLPSPQQQYAPSSTSSRPLSPLHEAIEEYKHLDLHRDDEAFQRWMERKRKHKHGKQSGVSSIGIRMATPSPVPYLSKSGQTVSIYQTPTSAPPPTPAQTSFKNPRASHPASNPNQNDAVFNAWLAQKRTLQSQLRNLQRATLATQRQKEAEEERRRSQHAERVHHELMVWEKAKRGKEEEERQLMVVEERRKKEREEEKRERGKRAFEVWKRQSRERDKEGEKDGGKEKRWVPKQAWVDVVPKSGGGGSAGGCDGKKGKGKRKGGEGVLSPPHLYREYDFYSSVAPDYLRKYRILVASGGATGMASRGGDRSGAPSRCGTERSSRHGAARKEAIEKRFWKPV
ncbi:hypothetical protein HDV00_005131 [Rhizophlyctis rosea]|nr:hypothetical protein HDV00_005131 [Rhizophlyctis rosea]